MKYLVALFVVLAVLVFVAPAYADSPIPTPAPTAEPTAEPPTWELPDEFPPTAEEGLKVVEDLLKFVAALVTMYVMNGIKKLPLLSGEQKSLLQKFATEAIAGVAALLIGAVLAYGVMVAGFLDQNGFWQVLKWVWPLAFGIYHGKKLTKSFL